MMAGLPNPLLTAQSKKKRLKDEYYAMICNHRASFDSKINNIIVKYSLPNVDKRVVDLVAERIASNDEEEPQEAHPPPALYAPAFPSGMHSVNTPIDPPSSSVYKPVARACLARRAAPCRIPVLSFRGSYLRAHRNQKLRCLASLARRTSKRRAALPGWQPETRERVLGRSSEVCGIGDEEHSVTSVGENVLTPAHIGLTMLTPQHCRKSGTVMDSCGSKMENNLFVKSSVWHSTPQPCKRWQKSQCSDFNNGARSPDRDMILSSLCGIKQFAAKGDKLPSSQLSGSNKGTPEGAQNVRSSDDSSEEFLLLSDFEEDSRSPPRPRATSTLPRCNKRSQTAAKRSLMTSWNCRPLIPDSELPAEMFDVMIVDDPKPWTSASSHLVTPGSAGAPACIYDRSAADQLNAEPINDPAFKLPKFSPNDSLRSSPGKCSSTHSSGSSISSGCRVLLHYSAGTSTQGMRILGPGRTLPIFT